MDKSQLQIYSTLAWVHYINHLFNFTLDFMGENGERKNQRSKFASIEKSGWRNEACYHNVCRAHGLSGMLSYHYHVRVVLLHKDITYLLSVTKVFLLVWFQKVYQLPNGIKIPYDLLQKNREILQWRRIHHGFKGLWCAF